MPAELEGLGHDLPLIAPLWQAGQEMVGVPALEETTEGANVDLSPGDRAEQDLHA